jgi:hypothetical protein
VTLAFIRVINTFAIKRDDHRSKSITTSTVTILKPIMNINCKASLLAVGILILFGPRLQAQSGRSWNDKDEPMKRDTVRSTAQYFTAITKEKKNPDNEGFIQRWLLLEPIAKPNRTNSIFTDSYLRKAFDTLYFPNQFTILPKHGDKVKVGKEKLMWHALDSKTFNVKLFRFAYGINRPVYGVLFWAVTIVNSPHEMKDVRLAVGSNSASMWWLNGKEAVLLSGDRRMVMDDCVSTRLTINKGKNVIRGVVINGPGMSDFCVRFLDSKGEPIKDLTMSYE